MCMFVEYVYIFVYLLRFVVHFLCIIYYVWLNILNFDNVRVPNAIREVVLLDYKNVSFFYF